MLKKTARKLIGKKPAPLRDYKYSIDVVDAGVISGWAKNVKLAAHKPVIDIYAGKNLIWQTKAENYRDDLEEAGIGDFAFHLQADSTVLFFDLNEIDIYIDGHKANQQPFPFLIRAGQGMAPAELAKSAEDVNQSVKGAAELVWNIDAATQENIVGWAKSNLDLQKRLLIEFRSGDAVLATGTADRFREDLLDANIGDGRYGFNLEYNFDQFPAEEVAAQLYIDGSFVESDPFVLNVDSKALADARFRASFGEQLSAFEQDKAAALERITAQIQQFADEVGESNMNVAVNVVLQNLAELNVRVGVLEQVLVKHFATK